MLKFTHKRTMSSSKARLSLQKVKNRALKTKTVLQENIIRVMSFNIHLKDCEEKQPEECSWKCRKEFVASMIRFHHMDIIGSLQGRQEPYSSRSESLFPSMRIDESMLSKVRSPGKEPIITSVPGFPMCAMSFRADPTWL